MAAEQFPKATCPNLSFYLFTPRLSVINCTFYFGPVYALFICMDRLTDLYKLFNGLICLLKVDSITLSRCLFAVTFRRVLSHSMFFSPKLTHHTLCLDLPDDWLLYALYCIRWFKTQRNSCFSKPGSLS